VAPEPKHPGLTTPPGGPKLSCSGGRLKGDDCVCPRGKREVKLGARAFRCVSQVSDPKTTISCAGGFVRGHDCVCPRGTKEVKAGPHAFRCVRHAAGSATVRPLVKPSKKLILPPRPRTNGMTIRHRALR
jgi:hypothetical protein